MTILVTGAGGMVGSHMIEILTQQGHNVIGTYYKPTIDMNELSICNNLFECDIRYPSNIERIIHKFMPDKIFHLAAQSYPVESWSKPYETMDININGTIAVFESIIKLKEKYPSYDPIVITACSSAEYGVTLEKLSNPKVKETAELLPLHPYGISKVAQDLLSYQYYVNNGIKTIRARIFNTTGVRKVNDVTSDFTKRAIDQVKSNITNPVLQVGNIESYRAIMDVRDLIDALILLSDDGTYGEAYNISSEKAYKISEIISVIEKSLNLKFKLQVDQDLLRSNDEKIIIGDTTKLKKDTNWKQKIHLEDTINSMLKYWQTKYKVT